MDCELGYKQEHNISIIQHFECLLSSLDDSGNEYDYDQPAELIQIIQETINKMIIELSLFASSNDSDSIPLHQKKRFFVNKFFVILTNLVQSNANILTEIQNIDISVLQKRQGYLIKPTDFSFLSNFQLTNLILIALKNFQDDCGPVLELLISIQEIDFDFFISLFQFNFNLLTDYLYNILKAQYLSNSFLQTNISILSLIILAENTDFFFNEESMLSMFNFLLQDLVLNQFHALIFKNAAEVRNYERIILLHAEMNIQKFFKKGSSKVDSNLAKSQLDILNFFMTLALEAKSQIFDKVIISFILQIIELDEDFDINSFLIYNEYAHQFLQQVSSNLLVNFNEDQESENEEEKANIFTDINIESSKMFLDLISMISISVDSLPDSLCDAFFSFVLNQFYHSPSITSSTTEPTDSICIKDLVIIAIANLTSITGRFTDLIVSYGQFLEDIIETIDESSFETKIHICVIFSNLLFESSQYFDSLFSRINIVEKLKPLIWSSIPSLNREVCTIFLNILMNLEDDGIATSICFELKEEGIIESLSMMLNESNSTEFEDKNYIFQLSEALNNFLF